MEPMIRELMLVSVGLATLHAQEAAAGRPIRPVWHDEFELPAGTGPDRSKWTFDVGQTGWGNAELEEYTASTANAFHDGEGHLIIQAIALPGGKYTSARLK